MIKQLHNYLLGLILLSALGVLLLWGQADFNPWSNGCGDGETPTWNAAAGKWKCQTPGGGSGVPAGAILLIVSGSCPSGFTEETSLDGKTLFGTLAAHADVGGTGGADAITPAGSNSTPTFTGDAVNSSLVSGGTPAGSVAWPVGVPTFAGDASTVVVNHVHVQNKNSATTGPLSGYGVDASTNTSVASDYSTANPTGGAASYTPAGTISWPAGVPTFSGSALGTHQHSATATGAVSQPTFTGTQFDNRSANVKVIFCKKS